MSGRCFDSDLCYDVDYRDDIDIRDDDQPPASKKRRPADERLVDFDILSRQLCCSKMCQIAVLNDDHSKHVAANLREAFHQKNVNDQTEYL